MKEQLICCENCTMTREVAGKDLSVCVNSGCKCHVPVTDYGQVDHAHCWDNEPSPCGIPLSNHTKCCLCGSKVPVSQQKSLHSTEEAQATTSTIITYTPVSEPLIPLDVIDRIGTVDDTSEPSLQNGYMGKFVGYKTAPDEMVTLTPTPPPTEGYGEKAHLKWLSKAKTAKIDGSELTVLPYGYLQTAVDEAVTQALAKQKARMVEVVEGFKGEDLLIDEVVDDIIKALSN